MKYCGMFCLVAVLAIAFVWLQAPGGRRDVDEGGRLDVELSNAPAGTVIFRGGYDTDPRDHGRPVSLIAAALGVESDVFRQAFSGVNPSSMGAPSPMLARTNKKVLMDALSKYGVSNERLDQVSNYYRYNRSAGKTWQRSPATATAVIKDGKVAGITITNPGAGYTVAPSFANNATQFVRDTVGGKMVRPVQHNKDQYGRVIADIYLPVDDPLVELPDMFLNRELVKRRRSYRMVAKNVG
ncbi:MAG: thermonuclease family protein [Fuerstiella sp.]